jgi:hypothetical protein
MSSLAPPATVTADAPAAPGNAPAPALAPRAPGPGWFWRRMAVFWAPVVLVLGALEGVLWASGEVWPVERVLDAQAHRPETRFLRAWVDQDFYRYKRVGMERARPALLAVGSSRVMKLRAPMFGADSARFYNAGGMVQDLDDLAAFARWLPARSGVRLALLGVDMWWLNPAYPGTAGFAAGVEADAAREWQAHLAVMRALVLDPALLRRAADAAFRGGRGGIGLGARFDGSGFRRDGSLASGLAAPATAEGWRFVDRERPTVAERIRTGGDRFQRPDSLSLRRLRLLEQSLDTLAARGVLVAGFLPPLSAEAAALLEADPRQRVLWREYRRRVAGVFRARGLPFVDASTTAALGLDDRYLVDGAHGEETFHLHLLRRLLRDPRVRAAAPGAPAAVEAALASPRTSFWYADYGAAPLPAARAERAGRGDVGG